ncbi:transposase [Streptomyces griseomycini]|uniref:transposase n=1 Tax=Streptomyces griseomycini TaxID=66895 RepID=UPI0019CED1D8|nr:transposase [Streptomyces griseomycini]GGR35299.1 hypothetical protein GCM10015536_46150 [Streptomyces griseomycini]
MERLRGESAEFVAEVFASLPRRDQRRWGACCLRGLVLDGRRRSFPKCGAASVGVARQCCGAVGRQASCQVAVGVRAATDAASCPLNWELRLPRGGGRTNRSAAAGRESPTASSTKGSGGSRSVCSTHSPPGC